MLRKRIRALAALSNFINRRKRGQVILPIYLLAHLELSQLMKQKQFEWVRHPMCPLLVKHNILLEVHCVIGRVLVIVVVYTAHSSRFPWLN